MRTEVSAKFREAGVAAELSAAGLAMRSWWTDPGGQFGLSLAVPA
jgi:L-histidine N-alpha-methyltransferase